MLHFGKPRVLGRVALWLPINIGIGMAPCLHRGVGLRALWTSKPHLHDCFCMSVGRNPRRSLKKMHLRSLEKMNRRTLCLIDHHAVLGMARTLVPIGRRNPWRRNLSLRNQ